MRRVNTFVLLCAVGLLMLVSCDKPTITVPVSNEPVFVLDGTLSGEDFSLVAGDDNAYMHTRTEVVNGVNLFTGELSNGELSVELGIFDGMIDKPGHITVDEIENIVPTFSRRSTEPLIILEKAMLGNAQNIESVVWYVNNSLMPSDEVPMNEPGKYDICAFITFNNGDEETICDDIIIGYKKSAKCSIDYSNQQGQIVANVVADGAPVQTIEWFINDDYVNDLNTFNYQSQEAFRLKARVTFANGVVRTRTVRVNDVNSNNYINDFSAIEMGSIYDAPNQDFNIRLKIESDGLTYLSEYADNTNSSLIVTGVEYFGLNEEGNEIYKISGIVDAVVMELVSEKMVSVNFSTVFGFEIQ